MEHKLNEPYNPVPKSEKPKTRIDEIVEIAQRLQREVDSDNFDTVFNAIIRTIYPL